MYRKIENVKMTNRKTRCETSLANIKGALVLFCYFKVMWKTFAIINKHVLFSYKIDTRLDYQLGRKVKKKIPSIVDSVTLHKKLLRQFPPLPKAPHLNERQHRKHEHRKHTMLQKK